MTFCCTIAGTTVAPDLGFNVSSSSSSDDDDDDDDGLTSASSGSNSVSMLKARELSDTDPAAWTDYGFSTG